MKLTVETHSDYITVALERNDSTKGLAVRGVGNFWMGYGMSDEELSLCKTLGEATLHAELEGE